MKIRILIIILIAVAAGFLPNSGFGGLPRRSEIIVHFIAPPLLAAQVVFLLRSLTWKQQLLLLIGVLLLPEIVRIIRVLPHLSEREARRLFNDSKLLFLLFLTVGFQVAVGLISGVVMAGIPPHIRRKP